MRDSGNPTKAATQAASKDAVESMIQKGDLRPDRATQVMATLTMLSMMMSSRVLADDITSIMASMLDDLGLPFIPGVLGVAPDLPGTDWTANSWRGAVMALAAIRREAPKAKEVAHE